VSGGRVAGKCKRTFPVNAVSEILYMHFALMLVENFKEWACSFSGCDGGDLKSPVWLCGIEWGFSNPDGLTGEEYEEGMSERSLRLEQQCSHAEIRGQDPGDCGVLRL